MWRTIAITVSFLVLVHEVYVQTDVWARLGTTVEDAQDTIFTSLATGVVARTGRTALYKAATAEQQAAFVREGLRFARAFTGTADFARRYGTFRAFQRPQPAPGARTGEEARAAQQKAVDDAAAEAEKMAASLPADERRQLDQNIEEMRKQIAELNADPEYRAEVDQATREFAQRADIELAEKLAEFERQYPADPTVLIAERLRRFLEVCNGIDFDAPLQQGKDRRYRFVDPALEQKPREWKLCYRAGRPAVEAARRAAEEWLKAL